MHNFFQIYFHKCCKKIGRHKTDGKHLAELAVCSSAGTFHTAHFMAVLFSTCFRA